MQKEICKGKEMLIRIDVESGDFRVTNENGDRATEVDLPEVLKITKIQSAAIFNSKSSPGCIYFTIAGISFAICW